MSVITTRKGEQILVDEDLFEVLDQLSWHISTNGYAINRTNRDGRKVTIRMHRWILELKGEDIPDGMDVDHINGNRLDNRSENLRICNRSDNLANTPGRYSNKTGFRYVRRRYYGKYRAIVCKEGKQYMTTQADTPEEAARLGDRLALELHGEYAVLNFPAMN